jgi:hypothetical protein
MEALGPITLLAIGGMVDAITDWYFGQKVWVDSFQATDVVAIFVRVRTPLMMGVDAAVEAEVVFRDEGVELI